ncbi:MAG: hypothetical protein ACTHWA_12285 [Arachnia sp.]
MLWPGIALDTRVADLAGRHVAVKGMGPDGKLTVVLATFGRLRGGELSARVCDTATREPMPTSQRVSCPGSVSLSDFVLAHTAVRSDSAAEAPRIRWQISGSKAAEPVMILLLVAVAVVALLRGDPGFLVFAVPVAASAWWQRDGRHLMLQPAVIADSWQLVPSQVMARMPHDAIPAGPTPRDRVDVVKAAYGQLLSDIVYRIENSALFDNAHSPTNRFQVALLTWDPESPHAAQMAEEIEVSFADARRDAEQLGLGHLPLTARTSAQRAAKAARTALSDAPATEKAAALGRTDEILTSLALYYLPSVDRTSPSLIGSRREIEFGR